jgi:hypothetical protein
MTVLNAVLMANPIGLIVAAIVAVIAFIVPNSATVSPFSSTALYLTTPSSPLIALISVPSSYPNSLAASSNSPPFNFFSQRFSNSA